MKYVILATLLFASFSYATDFRPTGAELLGRKDRPYKKWAPYKASEETVSDNSECYSGGGFFVSGRVSLTQYDIDDPRNAAIKKGLTYQEPTRHFLLTHKTLFSSDGYMPQEFMIRKVKSFTWENGFGDKRKGILWEECAS